MSVVHLRAHGTADPAPTDDSAGREPESEHEESEAPASQSPEPAASPATLPATSRETDRPARGVRHMSLGAKLTLIVVVFLAVPIILYGQFEQADREKTQLLLESVREQGRLIATALTPVLGREDPSPLTVLPDVLDKYSGSKINTKVLYRPSGTESAQGFFYVAASPSVSATFLESERERLSQAGVLSQLATSCALDLPAAMRHRPPSGGEELITSVTPVLNEMGCWAVVVSYSAGGLIASSIGKPYWQTPEIQVAAIIYVMMALLIISIFVRVWGNVTRFSRLASDIRKQGTTASSFSRQNTVRELSGVAVEFDRMVDALRKLSGAVERSPTSVIITDAAGRIEYVNPAFSEMTGYSSEDVIGQEPNLLKSGDTPRTTYEEMWDTISSGRVWRGELCNARKNGTLFWALVSISSSKAADGTITHYIGLQEDITERKQVERQRSLLLAELNHRVKNTLATVKSIATQTLRQSPSIEKFRESFEGRLRVLALANDLLTQTSWKGANLRTVSERALQPFHKNGSGQVVMDGPTLMLSPKAALSFSLTLHELATNAAKYGALSGPLGNVEMRWWLKNSENGQLLIYRWTESGGPPVTPPSRHGFGTSLIEKGMAYELSGEVVIDYLEDGLHCEIIVPLSEIAQPPEVTAVNSPDLLN